MPAPERPRNFSLILQRPADPKDPPQVFVKLQVLYHPVGFRVEPHIFANGFEQLVYTDALGRDMFLPILDEARAGLSQKGAAPATQLELVEGKGLLKPGWNVTDITTRMRSDDAVFSEPVARTGTSGDQ